MTKAERLELLKQIEKDIYVPSIESTFLDDAKSCAIHSAIEELEQKPKTGDWIPVSERLPEKGKQVLCCNRQGSVFTSAITYKSGNMIAFGQHCGVIAWMTLPEPYKAESEE